MNSFFPKEINKLINRFNTHTHTHTHTPVARPLDLYEQPTSKSTRISESTSFTVVAPVSARFVVHHQKKPETTFETFTRVNQLHSPFRIIYNFPSSVCELELTIKQRYAFELKGNVVLLGEDKHRAAGLREEVQVQLQRHDCL